MKNQKLTDITRGLQHAAQTTLSMLAEQYIRTLDQFFVPHKTNGIFEAKTIRVKIDEKNYVNIPLITLVNPKGLALEKMRVNMSVRVEEAISKHATGRFDPSGVKRTAFTVSAAPRGLQGERRKTDVIDMELEFHAGEPPEALMRISDLYANTITPIPRPPTEGTTPREIELELEQKGWYPDYRKEKWYKNYVDEYYKRMDQKDKNPDLEKEEE